MDSFIILIILICRENINNKYLIWKIEISLRILRKIEIFIVSILNRKKEKFCSISTTQNFFCRPINKTKTFYFLYFYRGNKAVS
jgi:hypothetical protein